MPVTIKQIEKKTGLIDECHRPIKRSMETAAGSLGWLAKETLPNGEVGYRMSKSFLAETIIELSGSIAEKSKQLKALKKYQKGLEKLQK